MPLPDMKGKSPHEILRRQNTTKMLLLRAITQVGNEEVVGNKDPNTVQEDEEINPEEVNALSEDITSKIGAPEMPLPQMSQPEMSPPEIPQMEISQMEIPKKLKLFPK